ncbi:MAG: MBL fold metallo-hydrolase [Pseudomonadota bacterium]
MFKITLGLILGLAGVFWWLMLSGSTAPANAPDLFPIGEFRAEVLSADPATLPTEVRILELGKDKAPAFAAQAGRFGAPFDLSYTSFEIVSPEGSVIVGGAVDAATADQMTQSAGDAQFYPERYAQLIAAMETARHVVMTHEHIDHVMAIARHPAPAKLAPNLRLNAPQKAALPRFTLNGDLPAELADLEPTLSGRLQMIAPGVVIVPNAGHTEGSQSVFVKLQDGREYLLIGDIVWTMSNIRDLKTRPLLTQYVVFDPNENRAAVKRQVGALNTLAVDEPALIIVPSHDRTHLQNLIAADDLVEGFQ